MKLRTAFALAVAALTIGIPVGTAGVQPDALDRYLSNNAPEEQPDAIGRYLQNHSTSLAAEVETTGAAGHPDSRAVRPGPTGDVEPVADGGGRDWTTGAWGALGGVLFALLAIVGASAIRERRRLVLR